MDCKSIFSCNTALGNPTVLDNFLLLREGVRCMGTKSDVQQPGNYTSGGHRQWLPKDFESSEAVTKGKPRSEPEVRIPDQKMGFGIY